jgi:hypothetical protein
MDRLELLPDALIWRPELFWDDRPLPVCVGRIRIDRTNGLTTIIEAPLLQLATSLALCFERSMLAGERALEYLWDTGEQVGVSPLPTGMLSLELPVGTEHLRLSRIEFARFSAACFGRAVAALADAQPATAPLGYTADRSIRGQQSSAPKAQLKLDPG